MKIFEVQVQPFIDLRKKTKRLPHHLKPVVALSRELRNLNMSLYNTCSYSVEK